MRTIVIWDECGEAPLSFFVVEEDWTRFNNIYGNCAYMTPDGRKKDKRRNELGDELSRLVYGNDGVFCPTKLESFPVDALLSASEGVTSVIVAGFLP